MIAVYVIIGVNTTTYMNAFDVCYHLPLIINNLSILPFVRTPSFCQTILLSLVFLIPKEVQLLAWRSAWCWRILSVFFCRLYHSLQHKMITFGKNIIKEWYDWLYDQWMIYFDTFNLLNGFVERNAFIFYLFITNSSMFLDSGSENGFLPL